MTSETLIRKAKHHWINAEIAEKDGKKDEAMYHLGVAMGLLLAIDKTEKEQNKIKITDIKRVLLALGERLK